MLSLAKGGCKVYCIHSFAIHAQCSWHIITQAGLCHSIYIIFSTLEHTVPVAADYTCSRYYIAGTLLYRMQNNSLWKVRSIFHFVWALVLIRFLCNYLFGISEALAQELKHVGGIYPLCLQKIIYTLEISWGYWYLRLKL